MSLVATIERRSRPENPQSSDSALCLSGTLDTQGATQLLRQFKRLVRKRPRQTTALCLDFSAVSSATEVGAAAVAECLLLARRSGLRLRALGIGPQLAALFRGTPAPNELPTTQRPGLAERTGNAFYEMTRGASAVIQLLADAAYWALIAPFRGRLVPPGATTEQAVRIGVEAVAIACVTVFLIGLSTAFQAAHQLRAFGANIYVANLVAVAMVYELGPVVTAIVVAGRSGSAIAAELGTMTVGEEIDALRTMGIDPVRFLVVPRLYAITIVQPALTILATSAGILGGFLIAASYLDLSPSIYLTQTLSALQLRYVVVGLLKSLAFSWVIALTGSHYGLRITGGAAGVGRATTMAVVASIFAIIFADSLITTFDTTLR